MEKIEVITESSEMAKIKSTLERSGVNNGQATQYRIFGVYYNFIALYRLRI